MNATPTIPASLEQVYEQRRAQGADHREAADAAMHAFGGGRRRAALVWRVDRAREAWEREHEEAETAPIVVGDDLGAEQDAPDEFTDLATEIAGRVATLQQDRSALALDALTDPKAKARLATVEAKLSDAEGEAVRVRLARDEARRREQQRQDEAKADAKQAAFDRADALQQERARAEGRIAKAADAYAKEIAELYAVASRHVDALGAATGKQAGHMLPLGSALLRDLKGALRSHGAATSWLD